MKRSYDSDDEAEREMGYDLLGFQREAKSTWNMRNK